MPPCVASSGDLKGGGAPWGVDIPVFGFQIQAEAGEWLPFLSKEWSGENALGDA